MSMLYCGDGGIILKKLDEFFKQHPFYYSFGISIGVIVLQTLVNIIQHRPMFDEIGSILYGIGIILFSLLIARLTHRVYVRFGAAFIINFAYFSIQMFFDDSYVNYTSFIVTGGVAILMALLMLLLMYSFEKAYKK